MASSKLNQFQYQLVNFAPNLRAFAVSLSRDPCRADDLVQETLAKALKCKSQFVSGTNLKAWLFTILRNTFLSDLRKRKSEVEDPHDGFASRITTRGAQEGHMDYVDFAKALDDLPVEQREALILIGNGHSYTEVAVACGCAVGTVKSRVNRARVKLREMLALEQLANYGADKLPSSREMCAQ